MPIPQSSCPACGAADRRPMPVHHAWREVTWQLVRCTPCGHRYTDPMPTDAELTAMYDRSYFEQGGAWVCGFWSGSYADNEAHLREEARDALAQLPIRSGHLLEIGCAGGFFLDEARRAGFDVVGCELNPEMAQFGRERLGLTIHEGLFEQQGFPAHSFDVIAAQDVLEHTREPARFLAHAVTLLAPGGTLFIRGPLEETTRERIYLGLRTLARRGSAQVPEPPFHLQGFTRTSFAVLVERAGLRVQTFDAAIAPPKFRVGSLRDVVTLPIEWVSYATDRMRQAGDFMTACAVRPVATDPAADPVGPPPGVLLPGELAPVTLRSR